MATPAAKVFAIPELLEAILLELPTRDLLLAQAVNVGFRDTIKSSIEIRRALFYEQTPASTSDAQAKPRINPLINRMYNFGKRGVSLHNHLQQCRYMDIGDRGEIFREACYHLHAPLRSFPPKMTAHSPGSWRDMFMTHPPCPVVIVDEFSRFHVMELAARTMGELVEDPLPPTLDSAW